MAELAPVTQGDVVVNLNPKTMRTNSKLPNGDPKSMHPVPKRVGD